MADEQPGAWPRGTGEAQKHANPADPTLPLPQPSTDIEAAIVRKLTDKLPHYGSPEVQSVQFAEVYARLLAVSVARAEFYGELLAEEYRKQGDSHYRSGFDEDTEYDPGEGGGIRAIVGNVYDLTRDGVAVPTSEMARALVKLESEERDRAAKLARDGIRIGIEAKQVDVMRSYGHTVVASLRLLCDQLGVPWNDEATRRAAQRAIVTARTGLGVAVVGTEHMGLPLSPEDRARLTGGRYDLPQ